jgi:hypothetical protein
MAEQIRRLPLHTRRRIQARDAKLLQREEAMAVRDGALKTSCQCNVCIVGIRDEKILLKSVRTHLELYGHHPYHRGSTQVRSSLP